MYLFKHTCGTENLVDDLDLAQCVLDIYGGGYTVKQTKDAMIARNRLEDGMTVKRGGWTVKKEAPGVCS